jgi:hypothetical protein
MTPHVNTIGKAVVLFGLYPAPKIKYINPSGLIHVNSIPMSHPPTQCNPVHPVTKATSFAEVFASTSLGGGGRYVSHP